jgi:hypothetical protein
MWYFKYIYKIWKGFFLISMTGKCKKSLLFFRQNGIQKHSRKTRKEAIAIMNWLIRQLGGIQLFMYLYFLLILVGDVNHTFQNNF